MNAIRPLLQIPVSTDPTPSSMDSAAPSLSSDNQGFSAAMQSAGSRPARKSTPHRNDDSSGASLPPNGNHSPSPAQVPQASSHQPAAAGNDGHRTDNSATKSTAVQSSAASTGSAANLPAAKNAEPAETAPAATAPVVDAKEAAAAAAAAASAAAEVLAALNVHASVAPGAPPIAAASVPATVPMPAAAALGSSAASLPALPADGAATQTPAVAAPVAATSTVGDVHIAAQGGAASGKAVGAQAVRTSVPRTEASAAATPANGGATDNSNAATVGSDALAVVTTVVAQASTVSNPATPLADAAPSKVPFAGAAGDKPLDQTLDVAAAANADVRPATSAASAGTAQVIMNVVENGALDRRSHAGETASNSSVEGTAAAQASTTTATSNVPAAPQFKVAASVDSAEFGQGVASQVSVMVDNGLNTAKLQVNPASLGPIEVRIAIQGDHAQVTMASHSAVTRDALESSSPKLREMLSAQGFAQVSVDISHRSFQERSPTAHSYEWNAGKDAGVSAAAPVAAAGVRSHNSLLDAYA
jgi:flagellar hook-length control protein FliK